MSEQEKIISRLEKRGLLSESSIIKLRSRLKNKLKTEAETNEKEIVALKKELNILHAHFINY